MFKQKSLIGTELDNTTQIIELGILRNLNRALGKEHEKFVNARELLIHENIEVFPAFLLGHLINMPRVYKILSLGVNQVLLSRESIISHRHIKVGDKIKVQTFLQDAYEQQATSNPIGFVILDSVGSLNNEIAFYCERILAVRGGFNRGH